MILQVSSYGFCFAPYNPDGIGILCFNDSAYKSKVKFINKSELQSLWFYDLTLTAEQATVYVVQLGLSLEAHNQIPKTTEAMLMSKINTEKLWVYVQHLKLDQSAVTLAEDLLSPETPRFDASQFRTVPQGEVSTQRNMFIAEFKNVNIVIRPGEKVVLSFFGNFNTSAPSGTKIIGHNLVPLWSYSGINMKFNERTKPSEYIVQ